MSYRLTQTSESVYAITSGRRKIGSVFSRKDRKWVGKVGINHVIGDNPRHAFEEIVRVLNRIALCGVNNEEKAKAALEARNERARQQADEFEAFASLLNFATGNNVRAPRPRRRKILI